MNEVVAFLTANPVQYLATRGLDGAARVRPFMFCFEREGRLWFCTNHTKEVYRELRQDPRVEVCVASPDYAWLRLRGRAVFENDRAVKEGCMANPIVQGQYQTADNPIFEVFYLADAHAILSDFSGNPPRTCDL